LGTKLYIESLDGSSDYGFAIAEDTGGAIKGYKIDLFYNSNAEAMRFGRRDVKVYILD
jgi:3D (Asp-Asp-Asp) domain-containing protein